MKRRNAVHIFRGITIVILSIAVAAVIVMLLWNALMEYHQLLASCRIADPMPHFIQGIRFPSSRKHFPFQQRAY